MQLDGVRLEHNYATGNGGGVNNADPADYEWVNPDPSVQHLQGGRIEITDSVITGRAGGDGAGVSNSTTGTVVISDTQVTDNPGEMVPDPQDPTRMIPASGVFAPSATAVSNVGVGETTGTLRVEGSRFEGNWSDTDGAGIMNPAAATS